MEESYGVRQGSANKKGVVVGDRTMCNDVSQEDIANQLGMDTRSYANYKKLTTLIPELQELSLEGNITTSVASVQA